MKDVLPPYRSFRPSLLGFLLLVSLFGVRASAQPFEVGGHMQHSPIEGGCWLLISFEGKQYEILGDEEQLQVLHKDGAIVDLTAEPVRNAVSTCMVGDIIRVIKVNNVRMQPVDAPITPTNINGVIKRSKNGVWYVQQKNGMKYEFQMPPAKKYQRVGVRYKARVMVNVDPMLSREHMNGVIMLPPRPVPVPNVTHGKK